MNMMQTSESLNVPGRLKISLVYIFNA